MKERKILLIEDERKLSGILSLGLEEHNYSVQVADDGLSGYRLYQSFPFNLVLLDVNLPGMNGYEICKKIRKQNKHIPIIMLTALQTINNKLEGYEAGADDYVTKPFEFRELLMKMNVMLKRTLNNEKAAPQILRAADLQMNIDMKEVYRDGTIINLTAKEFQLLEYLLKNKNKVVTRNDIAKHVWEITFNTNTNFVDVYINYIRKKIDAQFDHKLIRTKVGIGYTLNENKPCGYD